MAANPNALMPVPEAEEFLGITSGSSDFDLEQRINALSTTFESRTRMVIKQRTFTGYRVDGTGLRYVNIPIAPVQSVSQVEIRYELDDSVFATLTSGFVLKDKWNGRLQLINYGLTGFTRGYRNILLTMVCGFDETDDEFSQQLSEIIGLFKRQLQSDFQLSQNKEEGLSSKSYQDGSVTFFPRRELLPDVEFGLDRLRLRRL